MSAYHDSRHLGYISEALKCSVSGMHSCIYYMEDTLRKERKVLR